MHLCALVPGLWLAWDPVLTQLDRLKGPGGQGTMLKAPAPIVPHQLHFGTSQRGTAASAGKGFFERVWEAKARTVRYMDFGKGGKEPVVAPWIERTHVGKGLADHLLEKRDGRFVHALMQRFGRYLQRLEDVSGFGGQLRECCFGITPQAASPQR